MERRVLPRLVRAVTFGHELGDAEAAENLAIPAIAAAGELLDVPNHAAQLPAVLGVGALGIVLALEPLGYVTRIRAFPVAAGERVVIGLVAENVLGRYPAVDRQIDVIARLVVDAHAVLAHLGGSLEAPVVDRIAHHLARLQGAHFRAALADQHLLVEVHAVVDVVLVAGVLRHGFHGVAALALELARRGLALVGEALAQAVAVRITPLTHLGTISLRECYL